VNPFSHPICWCLCACRYVKSLMVDVGLEIRCVLQPISAARTPVSTFSCKHVLIHAHKLLHLRMQHINSSRYAAGCHAHCKPASMAFLPRLMQPILSCKQLQACPLLLQGHGPCCKAHVVVVVAARMQWATSLASGRDQTHHLDPF